MSIKTNTTSLQDLLERVNELPKAENLDTEISTQTELISEQDAKIAELAQVLAGKAGGGSSSYNTCIVTINSEDSFDYPFYISYTRCVNGVVEPVIIKDNSQERVLENVICGSLIHLEYTGNFFTANKSDNVTIVEETYVYDTNHQYAYVRVIISASGDGEFGRYNGGDI
jgi:hypothetical protein